MLPTNLLPQVQQLLDRLAAINYENPNIDEQRIRDAFSQHLTALQLPDRPVEIYCSFEAAVEAARESTAAAAWKMAIETAAEAVSEAAREVAFDAVNLLMSEAAMAAAVEAAIAVAMEPAVDAIDHLMSEAAMAAAFEARDGASDAQHLGARIAAFEMGHAAASDPVSKAASKAAREAIDHLMSEAVMATASTAAMGAAFDAALAAAWKAAWKAAREAAWKAASSDAQRFAAWSAAFQTAQAAAFEAAFRAVNKPASDPLWNTAWNHGFLTVFDEAWKDAREAVKKGAKGAAPELGTTEWEAAWEAAFRKGWKRRINYATSRAFDYGETAVGYALRRSVEDAARDLAREAAFRAALARDWQAVGAMGTDAVWAVATAFEIVNYTTSNPEHDRLCAVWMPFVEALEAGLFYFWVTTTNVIVLTLPVMRMEADQLHADGQPAVQWSDWEGYYFWRGLQIPQKYGTVLSQNWRSQWLLDEPNAELRRVLIQGIGYDRIVQELEAVELDTWREYSLLKIQADVDVEPIHLLKMTCPSTNQLHVLRTPPNITSAREAIHWINWDVDPEAFVVET